jgi:hypothetical protein
MVRSAGVQLAAGSGAPTSFPLGPEINYIAPPDDVYGIVTVTDSRFVVVKHVDGTLYRVDVDPQAPGGRTITPIDGATVRQGRFRATAPSRRTPSRASRPSGRRGPHSRTAAQSPGVAACVSARLRAPWTLHQPATRDLP